jgi:guanine deaminase
MDAYMAEAVKEARRGIKNGDGGPFGAVIVRQGKIIARGHNRVVGSNDPTAHAEICAIREASAVLGRFDLSDCVIYTTCEPCPMCYAAVHWARIPKVYQGCTRQDAAAIGFDDKYIYDDIRGELSEKRISIEGIDREPCLEIFGEWESDPDRVRY